MEEEENFSIESLWILDRESGICIFEQNYINFVKAGISSDLVATFLSALLTFADEAFSDEIQHIKFPNRKISFKFSGKVLFVMSISTENEEKETCTRSLQNEIARRFNNKFETLYGSDNWSANITKFESFSQDLKEIVKKEPVKEKFLQIFDFKDAVAKIELFLNKQKAFLINQKEKLEEIFSEFKKKREKKRKMKLSFKRKKLENIFSG